MSFSFGLQLPVFQLYDQTPCCYTCIQLRKKLFRINRLSKVIEIQSTVRFFDAASAQSCFVVASGVFELNGNCRTAQFTARNSQTAFA
jgi:hypothetical protein